MKKINVSEERCIGCGACVAIDPEHFQFNDEGKSSVIMNENLESENIINAIESCPTSAIEMVEEQGNTSETEEQEETCDTCESEVCDCTECDCAKCEHHKEETEEN